MESRLPVLFWKLCKELDAVTVRDLAQELEISERTIYSDVKKLNELLRAAKFPEVGIDKSILCYPYPLEVEFKTLITDSEEFTLTNPRFRRLRLLEQILTMPEPFTLNEIGLTFQLSRNTLLRDLNRVREEMEFASVKLLSRPFTGFYLEGEEMAIRALLLAAVSEDPLFQDEDQDRLAFLADAEHALDRLAQRLGVVFSDEAYERLLLTCWVVKARLRLGKNVPLSALTPQYTKEENVFRREKATLETLFDTALPESEVLYLAQKVSEASVTQYNQLLSEHWVSFSLLVKQFLEQVSVLTGLSFFQEDEQLYEGILNHLRPAYKRAQSGEQVENPLYDYILKEHTGLNEKVTQAITSIEKGLNITFSPQEHSFFTLFLASSLERNRKKIQRTPSAILVCNAGISTSAILQSKLEAKYNLNVLGTYGTRRATEWLENNEADLVITTVPFHNEKHTVVQVHPTLTEQDQEKLNQQIEQLPGTVAMPEVMSLISRHAQIHHPVLLEQSLRRYFGIPNPSQTAKGVYEPMLLEVLNTDMITVKALCKNREEAVRASGNLLVQKGYAKPEYVDAMIQNVEENGTYIVIAPGIAMPHARPETGALDIGLSIVTLKDPVPFGHPTNDPVRIVVGLCAVDHQSHLKALAELVDILGNEEQLNAMLEAETSEDMLTIIKGGIEHD